MTHEPGGFSEDQSPFRFASATVDGDLAPPSEAILLLAETEFKDAIAAFDESGRLEAESAARLNALGARIKASTSRLRATLERASRLN